MDSPCLQRERQRKKNSEVPMCNHCCPFFTWKHFWHHKISCSHDTRTEPVAVPLSVMKSNSNNRFLPEELGNKILTKFSNDLTGKLCQTDTSILTWSVADYRTQWKGNKTNWPNWVSVRMDTCQLASLLWHSKRSLGTGAHTAVSTVIHQRCWFAPIFLHLKNR